MFDMYDEQEVTSSRDKRVEKTTLTKSLYPHSDVAEKITLTYNITPKNMFI